MTSNQPGNDENGQQTGLKVSSDDRPHKIATLEKSFGSSSIKQPNSQRLDTSLSQNSTNLDFYLDMADFHIQAPFEPTGDQPSAIASLVKSIAAGTQYQPYAAQRAPEKLTRSLV